MPSKPDKMPEYIRKNPKNRKEAGKGSAPRPIDKEKFDKGWDRIFGPKKKKEDE